MKKFSKILSVALLVALVLSLGVANAFAAPADTHIKVAAVTGHTYTAYQLFKGDLAEDGVTLSNVVWGKDAAASISYQTGVDGNGDPVIETVTPVEDAPVPQSALDYLATLDSVRDNGSDGIEQTTANVVTTWINTGNGHGQVIPEDETGLAVKTGYYVVTDAYEDPNADQTTTLSTNVVQIVGDVTIQPKAGSTTHKKEVADINDTTDTAFDLTKLQNIDAANWSESADHDFGDAVPFKLTTTIGSDFAKYTSYYLAVHDTMDAGLTFNESTVVVYVGDSEEPAVKGTDYTLTTSTANGKTTFDIVFNPLTTAMGAAAGKNVVVYYTATLNTGAIIGEPGNWNESYAEFSNNPNDTQSGKGKTPTDTAVVFTYKTVVNKIDKDENPLAGAEFTLTKTLKNGNTATVSVVRFKEETVDGTKKLVVTETTANGTTVKGDATTFSFNGLDDGTYTLTETVTPDGYNTIAPIVFKVVASHTGDPANKDSNITSLQVLDKDGNALPETIVFDVTPSAGSMETDVVNNSGTVLPSTGGIGTTIFYVVGGVLVLAAIILLVTKKRMSE